MVNVYSSVLFVDEVAWFQPSANTTQFEILKKYNI